MNLVDRRTEAYLVGHDFSESDPYEFFTPEEIKMLCKDSIPLYGMHPTSLEILRREDIREIDKMIELLQTIRKDKNTTHN